MMHPETQLQFLHHMLCKSLHAMSQESWFNPWAQTHWFNHLSIKCSALFSERRCFSLHLGATPSVYFLRNKLQPKFFPAYEYIWNLNPLQFTYVAPLEDPLEQKLACALTAVIILNYSTTSNSFSPYCVKRCTKKQRQSSNLLWNGKVQTNMEIDATHKIRHCCLKAWISDVLEKAVFLLQDRYRMKKGSWGPLGSIGFNAINERPGSQGEYGSDGRWGMGTSEFSWAQLQFQDRPKTPKSNTAFYLALRIRGNAVPCPKPWLSQLTQINKFQLFSLVSTEKRLS